MLDMSDDRLDVSLTQKQIEIMQSLIRHQILILGPGPEKKYIDIDKVHLLSALDEEFDISLVFPKYTLSEVIGLIEEQKIEFRNTRHEMR